MNLSVLKNFLVWRKHFPGLFGWLVLPFMAMSVLSVRAAVITYTYQAAATPDNWSTASEWNTGAGNGVGIPANGPTSAGNLTTVSANGVGVVSTVLNNPGNVIGIIQNTRGGSRHWTISADAGFDNITMNNTGGGNNQFGNANAAISSGSSGNMNFLSSINMANTDLDIGALRAANSTTASTTIGTLGSTFLNSLDTSGTRTLTLRENAAAIQVNGDVLTINSAIGSVNNGSAIAIVNASTTTSAGADNVVLAGPIGGAAGTAANVSILNTATSTKSFIISGVLGATVTSVTQNSTSDGMTLSAANTYTGNTTISSGIISIGSTATLGDPTLSTLILAGGTLTTTASRTPSSAPIGNPVSLTADSIVQTTSAATTVDLNFTNNSISGTAGTLTFNNAAASGPGLFEPRFTGSGFNFSRPIVIANGSFGTTRLDSYNTNGTTQTFSGVISGTGGYLRTASVNGSGAKTIFTGNNTYSGGTTISDGTLEVDNTTGSGTGSGSVSITSGGTLAGSGSISGNVSVASGGHTRPGNPGVTNTIGGNLIYFVGAKADFDLGSSATGAGNSQIILNGTSSVLAGSNVTININCGATLDQTTDYVLYQLTGGSATISTNFNATPTWLGTVPANSGSYVVLTDVPNKKVLLHYIAATPPTATGSANPSTVSRNQSTLITANVTPGSGTLTTVTVDLTAIGGAAAVTLVQSNSSSLYTNTVSVSAATTTGNKTLIVTATDSTPLAGTANIALTVAAGTKTWNGNGLADNWNTNGNWTSGLAPGLVGDALIFAGTTRLTPVMENNYTIASLTFGSTAGSFSISNANSGALTLTGGVTNNSTSAQMVTAPVTLSGSQTFNTASGDLAINGLVSGTAAGVTKVGSGTLSLLASNTFDGTTVIANGTLQLANSQALQNSALTYNAGSLTFNNITAATIGGLSGSQNLPLVNLASAGVALTVGGAGANTTYSGQLTGTGGSLTKTGTNTLTLTGNNSYSGSTTVSGGTLELPAGGSINGGLLGGSGFLIDGGSLTCSAGTSTLGQSSFTESSGTVTLDTLKGNVNDGTLIAITGGNFTATNGVILQRTASFTTAPTPLAPISASTGNGFYVNGATASASLGSLTIGTANSSASARVDAGTLVVTNKILVGNTSNLRWSILQVNGGTLTSLDAANGIVLGQNNGTTPNSTELYLSGGTSTAEKIVFGVSSDTVNNTNFFIINGGTLYLGSGGILMGHAGDIVTISLTNGTLGAKAGWSSAVPMQLSGTSFILKAADAANAANNITLSGALSGTGSLLKTGAGTLTLSASAGNSYTGTNLISAGTLLVNNATGSGTGSSNVWVTAGTLAGTGIITGATTVQSGGTLQPGLGGTDTSTLTISNTLALNGNSVLILNRGNAQNAAKVAGISTVTYGGTLTVTNTGAALLSGDTFNLFSATTYIGNFATVILPTLTSGLAWNTNNLTTTGTISVQPAISPVTLLVVSSSNPSGFNDAINFTAGVTPTNASGTIIFSTNGTAWTTNTLVNGLVTSANISNLPRGTNVITSVYSGDVNYYGATNILNQVVTNHPPVAGNATYGRNPGIISLHIAISELLTNVSDIDTDLITLTATGVSTNGITLTNNGTYLLYQNTNAVNDQFTYTVSDGNSGSATGLVTVVAQPFATGQNASVAVSGSTATVRFAGIPGYNYGIQRSTNLVGSWVTIRTTNAPSGGLFDWTDDFNDLGVVPASAYYRLQWNP